MKVAAPWFGAVLALAGAAASAQPLDEFLQELRERTRQSDAEQAEREARFRAERDRQQERLTVARSEQDAEEARGRRLVAEHERNQELIAVDEARLREKLGDLGELLGVVRQVAGDLGGRLDASPISLQRPERAAAVEELAASEELPTIEALREVWLLTLEEMVESGKTVRLEAEVVGADGNSARREVVRVGAFNVISGDRLLRYLAQDGSLAEPPRQPSRRIQALAERFVQGQGEELFPFPLDPTRGTLLSLLGRKPGLGERIRQGGGVGYVILALGAVALLIALERATTLGRISRRVGVQLDEAAREDNPLGRLILASERYAGADRDVLLRRLDEAVQRELPALQRGLNALAILAAVAPLLGLLGTVIGIIETFQSITLFGTGDPRIMSGGISQALVTTVMGLIVAIPTLLAHTLLSGRSRAIVQTLDRESAALAATRLASLPD